VTDHPRASARGTSTARGRGQRRSQVQIATGNARGPGPVWLCRHPTGAGTFEEAARRASHEELAVAKVLVAEGHRVRTVPERRGARSADLVACGTSVEVKAFQALAERGGKRPGSQAVANKILDARGQGAVAVLWGGESGLSLAAARQGYGMFCQRALDEGPGRLRAVRMIGAGFDISFNVEIGLRAARQARLDARDHARTPSPSSGARRSSRVQLSF